jgi:nicotinamide-nucleotide amidase
MANAEIVAIGSELLLGQIVDTNSAWMAQRLTNVGVNLYYKTIVGDNPGRMKAVIEQALERSDIVITGGGLGPTQDDLTREVIAEATGRKLVRDPKALEDIEQRFRRRGFIMTPNNERQADIPEGAIPVHNPNGTAPSFIVEDPRGVVFALPGVPHELKWLFDNEVIPYLRKKFDLSETITYRVLKVGNLGESNVDDRIGHLIANSTNPTVGVLAHPGQVDVRIAAKAPSVEEANKLIDPVEDEVRQLLGKHVFAVDEETLETAVGKLLAEKNSTIAVYEDLTSGIVADKLHQASADHFVEGIVGNSLTSIRRLIGNNGVSNIDEVMANPAVATDKLAEAIRAYAGADIGLAVHGVPEPGDMSQNLAKGTTYISVTDGSSSKSRVFNSAGRGAPDRNRTSMYTLGLLREVLADGF